MLYRFREVAAINVTNVNLIEEFVYSAAFSTFDQVDGLSFFVKMGWKKLNN